MYSLTFMITTLLIYVSIFLLGFCIFRFVTKDKVLRFILSFVFLFQFIIFPKELAFVGEGFKYYISTIYGLNTIPWNAPISFFVIGFLIKVLHIPEYIALDIMRASITAITCLFVYKISLYIFNNINLARISSILFGFSYVQFYYMAGDQFKNLIGSMFFIILVYLLIKKINIGYKIRDISLISIVFLLTILSHNVYGYIIPFIVIGVVLIRLGYMKSILKCILYSFPLVFLLVGYKNINIISIQFIDSYIKYGQKLGEYRIIDGLNHLGNTLFFGLCILIIIYMLYKKDLSREKLLLFFIFSQIFILSNMHLFGINLVPFRFTMINLPFIIIFSGMIMNKYVIKIKEKYKVYLYKPMIIIPGSILYLLLNILFVKFSLGSGSDFNDIWNFIIVSFSDPSLLIGPYVIPFIFICFVLCSCLSLYKKYISIYIKE